MTSSETREFIERYVRAMERADIDALVACYVDDCTVDSPCSAPFRDEIKFARPSAKYSERSRTLRLR